MTRHSFSVRDVRGSDPRRRSDASLTPCQSMTPRCAEMHLAYRLWDGPADGGTLVLTGMAAAAWLPFSLSRLCCRRVLAAEMLVPSQIASYGAWQMVWQFLSLRLVYLASPTAARVLVAVGQALQFGLLVWFLAACRRTRTAPEPFWNPPTVNVAVSTVAGIGVGLPAGFSVGCYVLALCLQLTLVPWQVWRTSCDANVSASPAVAMMQALHRAVVYTSMCASRSVSRSALSSR